MRQHVLDTLKRKNILYLLTLESTQNYAQDLLSKIKPIEGTAILTYDQTKGRGQYGTIWHSEPGKNISVSFILYPDFLPFKSQFSLSKAMALALAETLGDYMDVKVLVKWPNDIIVERKKLAGILINNSIQGEQWSHSIVGIGINVNQLEFSNELPHASSVYRINKQETDLANLVIALQKKVIQYYQKLKEGNLNEIDEQYLDLLYGYKHILPYQKANGEKLVGEIVGIEENGNMLLKTNSGIESFSIKEISLLL